MTAKLRADYPVTGRQVAELLALLHRHKPSASHAIVRGLHINRSTLSRWKQRRGAIPLDGPAGVLLARLHKRVVGASDAERVRFEAQLDWGYCQDDELALLSVLLSIAGVPSPPKR